MRQKFRILVGGFLLVAFGLGATNASLLLGASWLGAANGSCSLHAAKCCCPKICKVKAPPTTKPSCHKSDQPVSKISPVQTTGDTCVVKAGCDREENSLGYLPLLKDYLPEALEHVDFDPNRSILASGKDRFLLLDCSPPFFHPPKDS